MKLLQSSSGKIAADLRRVAAAEAIAGYSYDQNRPNINGEAYQTRLLRVNLFHPCDSLTYQAATIATSALQARLSSFDVKKVIHCEFGSNTPRRACGVHSVLGDLAKS